MEKFDFSKYSTLSDIGGGNANLCLAVARKYENMNCKNFDLPPVAEYANGKISDAGMEESVSAVAGNMLEDDYPTSDVICMSLIIHEWTLETKLKLVQKSFNALNSGGIFINIENMIDADRRTNLDSLLWSQGIRLGTGEGF